MSGHRFTALALACLALAATGAPAWAQPAPQGAAWQHADRAYEAFAAGDPAAASQAMASALALDPGPEA